MTTFLYLLLALILALIIWFLVSLVWGKPWHINLFYARVFWKLVFDNPELLTMLGILEKMGIHWHNAKLADASIDHETRQYIHAGTGLRLQTG